MNELGIDISDHRSKHVDELQDQSFDYVLTVRDSAKESCPTFPINQNAFTWGLKTRQRFKARNKSA
jgi:arsenate reductase